MIKTIAKDTYSIGNYTVKLIGDYWQLNGGSLDATVLFSNKWDALTTANLRYTCGELVSEGVRDVLLIMAADNGEEVTQ